MRKYVWLISILMVAMLLVAGCGKKQQSVVSTGGSTSTAPSASTTTAPAGGGASTLGDLIKKQSGLSSYIMTMDLGAMKMREAVKLQGGKPLAMKMDMGAQGWMLMQMDKKMQYMYNPTTKSAMAMPISDAVMSSSQSKDPIAALKALAGAKISSDKVDGVDCLKVVASQGTFWCEKTNGLPVQMDMGGKLMKFKYEQINSVPDSEFELPAGVKIQQMPAMPKAPK